MLFSHFFTLVCECYIELFIFCLLKNFAIFCSYYVAYNCALFRSINVVNTTVLSALTVSLKLLLRDISIIEILNKVNNSMTTNFFLAGFAT